MLLLHQALEVLRPKDFGEVPQSDLKPFLSDVFSKAELIANSVPPAPNGTPYESACRSRTETDRATSAATLTVSQVRRPKAPPEQAELHKAWGKPLKLSSKDAASGISVFKMAGNDRHGAWFARTSVHEGLGFTKWKRAMMREFPESLKVQGGPGEGNVRGIGGDKRLEDIKVPGLGKLEVYQLSAQFPGPVAPREFITLLLTSENALSDASKVGNAVPRHYMVVSIPVTHPDAPPRDGMVRGQYESVEMIREIPLPPSKSASSSDLTDQIDRTEDHSETNPVEWIMITRSDPGGGIPRFMVERNTPSSIVQDAGKFLQWACSQDDFAPNEEDEEAVEEMTRKSIDSPPAFSFSESNGILAGVGTSIVDNPRPASFRRPSQRTIMHSLAEMVDAHVPDALNPLHRAESSCSTSSLSSSASFASAEQFATAPEGALAGEDTLSEQSIPVSASELTSSTRTSHASRELEKIEQRRQQAMEKLRQAQEKQGKDSEEASLKTAKELEKATERHNRELKKQEERYAKEVQKLEARRERETKKLMERQQKEANKNLLLKTQHERDQWKERAEIAEQEIKLLKEQIPELQRENTLLVARMGKMEGGLELLKKVREEIEGKGRVRASSQASTDSKRSRKSKASHGRSDSNSHLAPG